MKNFILGLVAVGLVIFIVISFRGEDGVNTSNDQVEIESPEIDNVAEIESENLNTIASALQSGVWVWDRTVMNDDTIVLPKNTEAFTLSFDGKNVSGTTDCNGFGGEYTLSGYNSISFGPMLQTLMFCEDSQEGVFIKYVSESNSVYFDGEVLALLLPYDSGSVIFRRK